MKHRIIALCAALVLSLGLGACGHTETTNPIGEGKTYQTTTTTTTAEQTEPKDTNAPTEAEETTIEVTEEPIVEVTEVVDTGIPTLEPTVIVDQDGVKITAMEMTEDWIWGLGVKLLIENNTDRDLVFSADYLVVNNYMITDLFVNTVAAGKKTNETLNLSSGELEEAGINSIGEIAFAMRVYDDETWDDLFTTDEIILKTSAYDTSEVVKIDEGYELLNTDGIRIVARHLETDSIWGAGIHLFIENTREDKVSISVDDLSINGFMVTSFFSSSIQPGRYALDDITIMSSDLEENDIEEIVDIELIFVIRNSDSYDLIHESPPIAFSVQ